MKIIYDKNYLKLLLANSLSLFGTNITILILITWTTFSLNSAFKVSLITGVIQMAYLVISPFAGVIVDFFNQKKILWLTDLLNSLLMLLLASLFYKVNESSYLTNETLYYITLLLLIVSSILSALNSPAYSSYIKFIVTSKDMSQAQSILKTSTSVSVSVSGAKFISGYLYKFFGVPFSIVIDALTYFFSALIEFTLPSPKNEHSQSLKSTRDYFVELKSGVHFFFEQQKNSISLFTQFIY